MPKYLTRPYHNSVACLKILMICSLLVSSVVSLAQVIGQFKVDSLLANSLKARGQNYELAAQYADSALQLASKREDPSHIAKSYYYKAVAQSKLGKGKHAEFNYKKALERYLSLKDSGMVASTYMQLGNLLRTLDRSDEAIENLFKALELFNATKDSSNIGDSYLSIAILHGVNKDFEQAEEYLLRARAVYENINQEERQILVLSNLGTLYNFTGKSEEALAVTEKVKEYYSKNGPTDRHALALHNLGLQHENLGNHDTSLYYNSQSREIYQELGDKFQVAGIDVSMAKVYLVKGDLAKAEELANSAIEIARQIKSHNLIFNGYDVLYQIAKQRKNYKHALDYRLKFEEAKDSVFHLEKQAQIAELEARYENKLKEGQLQELETKNELNELQLKRKQNQQYLLWAAMGALLIIALLLFNQFRIKLKTNRLLRGKNEIIQKNLDEKEVLLKEIHHRVKNNMQFISSLLNLQSRHVTDANTLRVLNDCKNRVNSMAMVHQRLYQEENLRGVYMPHFVNTLLESLNHSYRRDQNKLNAEVDVAKLYLDVDTAIPIGLILNELITNVFKYAFEKDMDGRMKISLKETGDALLLQVEDNGRGLPEDFDRRNLNSFGLQLVESLSQKLKASLEIGSGSGTSMILRITNYKTT